MTESEIIQKYLNLKERVERKDFALIPFSTRFALARGRPYPDIFFNTIDEIHHYLNGFEDGMFSESKQPLEGKEG